VYRILVINWQDITHPLGGGAEVHFHEIFKRIVARGHQVTLLCCHYPGARNEEIIDNIGIIRRGNRALFNFYVPWIYRHLARENQYDVVFDDINKIPFFTPLFVKEPLIGIVHHLFGKSIFKEASFPAACYVYGAEQLIPWIYRKTPIMAVSPSSRTELVTKGMRADKIEIVYNGVDSGNYRPNLADKADFPLIGYMGRLKRYKSVHHLLQAFQQIENEIPDAKLLVVGDGDNLDELKALSQTLGVESKVKFTGFVSEAEKINYLNQMWVCVNPSPKEGWGVSVIEANACGTPVIAADSPGLRDSVVEAKTGLFYPFGEISQLAEKIVEIIRNHNLRDQLGTNSMEWALKYDWEQSANKTLELIEQTIANLI
jgi:glycosyltransferase involved in cell wall biosynthesis